MMNSVVKKVAIYLMIGMMQIGLGVSVIEASPLHNDSPKPLAYEQHQNPNEQDRHERERMEKDRHERAMKRNTHESEEEWRARQQRENERHEENMRRIAHDVLDLILDND